MQEVLFQKVFFFKLIGCYCFRASRDLKAVGTRFVWPIEWSRRLKCAIGLIGSGSGFVCLSLVLDGDGLDGCIGACLQSISSTLLKHLDSKLIVIADTDVFFHSGFKLFLRLATRHCTTWHIGRKQHGIAHPHAFIVGKERRYDVLLTAREQEK